MKLCKDCKHFQSDPITDRYATCGAPQAFDVIDPVTGERSRTWNLCSRHREAVDARFFFKVIAPSNRCGKSAHWFEPKN